MLPTESTVVGLVPDIPQNELCKVFDLAIGNKRALKATSFIHALDYNESHDNAILHLFSS